MADAAFLAADVTGPDEWADLALGYLAAVMDPRLPRLLARDLRYRPFALNEITRAEVGGGMRPIEFGAEIFEAVRGELRSGVTDPNIQQPLLEMLAMWGREAAEAAPDVVPLVGADPLRAAQALLAIAGPVLAAISDAARADLQDLAERPRRVIRSGGLPHVIHDDTALRFVIRSLLDS